MCFIANSCLRMYLQLNCRDDCQRFVPLNNLYTDTELLCFYVISEPRNIVCCVVTLALRQPTKIGGNQPVKDHSSQYVIKPLYSKRAAKLR